MGKVHSELGGAEGSGKEPHNFLGMGKRGMEQSAMDVATSYRRVV